MLFVEGVLSPRDMQRIVRLGDGFWRSGAVRPIEEVARRLTKHVLGVAVPPTPERAPADVQAAYFGVLCALAWSRACWASRKTSGGLGVLARQLRLVCGLNPKRESRRG
jgi:hypothetical protein